MELPPFLERVAYGGIRLTGHRIGLEHVVCPFREGASAEEIAADFSSLSLALVQDVLGFYVANRDFVDAYIAEGDAEAERQEAAAGTARFTRDELRRRFREKHGYEFPAVQAELDGGVRS